MFIFLSCQRSRNRHLHPFIPHVLSLGGWGSMGMAWGHQEPSGQPCLREPDSVAAPQAACRQFCPTGERPQTLNNLRPSSGSRPQTPHLLSSAGIPGGASHPLPGPRRRDRGHQGHLHPLENPQVRPSGASAGCRVVGALSPHLGTPQNSPQSPHPTAASGQAWRGEEMGNDDPAWSGGPEGSLGL